MAQHVQFKLDMLLGGSRRSLRGSRPLKVVSTSQLDREQSPKFEGARRLTTCQVSAEESAPWNLTECQETKLRYLWSDTAPTLCRSIMTKESINSSIFHLGPLLAHMGEYFRP